MRKEFSNQEILNIAILLADNFVNEDKGEIELPIRINFYLQKNIQTFSKATQEIQQNRIAIGKKYGKYNSDSDVYFIEDLDDREIASQELDDLLSLKQVLEVYTITLEDLETLSTLTASQMRALMFMIDENPKQDSKEEMEI